LVDRRRGVVDDRQRRIGIVVAIGRERIVVAIGRERIVDPILPVRIVAIRVVPVGDELGDPVLVVLYVPVVVDPILYVVVGDIYLDGVVDRVVVHDPLEIVRDVG